MSRATTDEMPDASSIAGTTGLKRGIDDFEQLDETVLARYVEYLHWRVAVKEAETTDGGSALTCLDLPQYALRVSQVGVEMGGYIQENYARAGLAESNA